MDRPAAWRHPAGPESVPAHPPRTPVPRRCPGPWPSLRQRGPGEPEVEAVGTRVEADEERVVGQGSTVDVDDVIARQEDPDGRRLRAMPVHGAHAQPVGPVPVDVVDELVRSPPLPSVNQRRRRKTGWARRSAMSRRVNASSRGRRRPSRTRRARSRGSRRCCCPAACGPARPRRGAWARPARGTAWSGGCVAGGGAARRSPASSVGPSTPQFQERLSVSPSRSASPLARCACGRS